MHGPTLAGHRHFYCRGLGRKWAAELCASEVAAQLPLLTPEELLTSLGDVAGGCLLGGLKSGSPSSSPGMFTRWT